MNIDLTGKTAIVTGSSAGLDWDCAKGLAEACAAVVINSRMPGVRLSRAYLKLMMEQGWGRIVFLSSVEAINITSDSLDYSFGRAAVLNLSRGLAKTARGSGVTVNAVLSGPTMTESLNKLLEGMAEQTGQPFKEVSDAAVKQSYPTSLNGRVHSVEEVANLVVYACSTQASAHQQTVARICRNPAKIKKRTIPSNVL